MEKQKHVVSETDLQNSLGLKGAVGRFIARRIHRFLEIDKINELHEKYMAYDGPEFSEKILQEVGVTYDIPEEQLNRIPLEGGFITVSNHHFGSIDGLILSSVIGSRRPDYRILTTFLLALIPSLRSSFMPVDNLSKGGSAKSIQGIRMALQHIHDGGALGFFPAGEVATYQKKDKRTAVGNAKVIEDKPWAQNIIKLIKNSGYPVIPIYFEGTNSKFFHFLGKIHPRLRTVRLIHELLNKKGTHVKVRIGQPISAEEISRYDVPQLGQYLRNRTYALEAECLPDKVKKAVPEIKAVPIAAEVPDEIIRKEIAAIEDRAIFEVGDYRCYLSTVDGIPHVMTELARLREETFRAVGEGTGKALDTDEFDPYYHHLILWNIPNGEIVGAYRLGVGSELVKNHEGISGFYTSTMFNFAPGNEELLSQCIELGRTFIRQKYQREVLALKLLLTGLSVSTSKFTESRYFLGPVSISDDLPDLYKSLTVYFLQKKHSNPEISSIASPTHAFKPNFLAVNPDQLLNDIETVDDLDRLIMAISDGKHRLPVLVKKYFNYNARLICFNVDPLFYCSLDGLILLKLNEFPKNYLRSLVKMLPEDLQDTILNDSPLS